METLRYYREALIDQPDVVAGTVRLSFASEAKVFRRDTRFGAYEEVLSHGPGDVNLGLLNTQGIVLQDHDETRQIGEVIRGSARVEADRKTRATVKITDPVWMQRIADGWRGGVSVGYSQLSVVKREQSDSGFQIITFSWAPYEVSLLNGAPADETVGLFRSKNSMNDIVEEALKFAFSGSRKLDGTLTREAVINDYSIADVIRGHELKGIQRAVHETTKYIGGDTLSGPFVRFDCLLPKQRDLTTGAFASGGAFVQSDMHPAIELLQNKVACISNGAQVFTGLTGHFLIPKINSTVTPQTLAETDPLAQSMITVEQPAVTPRRVSVQIPISKQLLNQTGPATEQVVRATIRERIAVEMDRLLLFGQGNTHEPLGIFNTPGIGAMTYGGAATWANVLLSEKSLADKNADIGNLGWAVSTATRNKWKQIPRSAGSSLFIMEGGRVNDYPALATTQLSNNDQSIFANWSDLWVLIWGDGMEFIIDDVTQAASGKVIVTVNLWFNSLVRHAESFCCSTDSAAI